MTHINNILNKKTLDQTDIISLLKGNKDEEITRLFRRAYDMKEAYIGKKVHYRGIIEFSNICQKNCFYCGIRIDNNRVTRYRMTDNEIREAAIFAYESGYGSIVLQGGEIKSKRFTDYITKLVRIIKKASNDKLGITLSLGEQSLDTYQKWFDAGAHRYLLRIETSNDKLYRQLHPPDHDFHERYHCLEKLRKIGYQVGTGMMIGLPNQTPGDIADDILFMKKIDVDMIGMGPFIPHNETPLRDSIKNFESKKAEQLKTSLKTIAITRLLLKDINIAATTALQALDPIGREKGIQAGANIIMPNITDKKYRESYKLYEDKPCMDENSSMCKKCLETRISSVNEAIGYNEWGDSPHFFKRTE